MIKVTDLAYGRLGAPDLERMEEFLVDFGMVRADRTKNTLYMRGTDGDHHIHVTELGEPTLISLAWWAQSEEDLKALTKADGASEIEAIDEPGGGKRVWLTDPDSRKIEIIHGMKTLAPLEVRDVVINTGKDKYNRSKIQRVPHRPSHVKRSAHAVVKTPDSKKTIEWYQSQLGFMTTDIVYADEDKNVDLLTFNHIDSGDSYVDHHVFLAVQAENSEFNHLSFEVADFDDVHMGHDYMKLTGKYKHAWGVGRHMLGSQIFDYWRDPWGRIHEHWTDTDLVNNNHCPGRYATHEGLINQWGPDFPLEFLDDPHVHAL